MDLTDLSPSPTAHLLGDSVTTTDRTPREPDPMGEIMAEGDSFRHSWAPIWTQSPVEAALRQAGPRLWDMLMDDDKAGPSVLTLAEMILSDSIRLAPVDAADPNRDGKPSAGEAKGSKLAREVADFCRFAIDRLDYPFEETISQQLIDGMIQGSCLAEKVHDRILYGPHAGKYVWHHHTVKTRESWGYVANRHGHVTGYAVNTVRGTNRKVGPGKFAVLQWLPARGNPNGSMILRNAYSPWNMKVQLFPQYAKYLGRFAEPSLIGTCGEGAQSQPERDGEGQIVPGGRMISAVEQLVTQMKRFKNGSIIGMPYGAALKALEIHGEGQAFLAAFDLLDRMIVFSILHQTMSTMESEHGTVAGSHNAKSVMGMTGLKGRKATARMIRNQYLRPLVRLNYGDDVAERFTPRVSLGHVDLETISQYANAVAKLAESGYLAESQLPSLDELLDLPVREPGSPRLTAKDELQGPQGAKGGKPTQKTPSKTQPKTRPQSTRET